MSRLQRTEAEMLQLLRQRYTEQHGNGDAWAFITGVRDRAGFDGRRTIDAIAMSLWKSRGRLLHGFEVKCSRSDWLRELKNPAKADAFADYLDRFWLVLAEEAIVQPGELPETWGLLVARGARLVCVTEAPALRPAGSDPGITRPFLAALLRSACRISSATPAEIREAENRARELAEDTYRRELEIANEQLATLRERERRFLREAGVDYFSWQRGKGAEEVACALRAALAGERDLKHLHGRVTRLAEDAKVLGEQAERILTEHTTGKPRVVAA